jgi:hypothetical protein
LFVVVHHLFVRLNPESIVLALLVIVFEKVISGDFRGWKVIAELLGGVWPCAF